MSDRKLVILGVVAALVVMWAVVQYRVSIGGRKGSVSPVYLIQGLDPADIGSIVLGWGEGAVTLKREGGRFVVVNKDNYPAEAKEINNLLSGCLEVRVSELYTDNPANHEELGVTGQKARSVVKFFRPDSKLITGIIVGKDRELGQAPDKGIRGQASTVSSAEPGSYVRLADSNSVYVSQNVPWFGGRAIDYIGQELVSIKREDISSVTVKLSGGEYTLKAGEDGKTVALENMPPVSSVEDRNGGRRLKSSDSETVFVGLTTLRFDDVRKNPGDLTFDKQFVCKLKDSTVYRVMIAQKDGKTYINCGAEFTDTSPVVKEKEVESEEQLKKKEAKLLARDKAKEFAARHQGWVYEIPDWKAKQLTRPLSELLEDQPKPKEKTEEPNAVKFSEPNAVRVGEPNGVKVVDPNAG
jgi:hypothetical protein